MSARTTPSILPIEVVELALDYLGDDVRSLVACCLVCRRWSSRARYNLFKRVRLDPVRIAPFFAAIGRDPTLAMFTRELAIAMDRSMPVTLPTHVQIPNLRTLRTLRLLSVDLRQKGSLESVSHVAHSAKELGVFDCLFATRWDLVRFVQRLPHLEHLSVQDAAWALPNAQRAEQLVEGLPALRSIEILGSNSTSPLTSLIVSAFLAVVPNGLASLSVLKLNLHRKHLPAVLSNLTSMTGHLRKLELIVFDERIIQFGEVTELLLPPPIFAKLLHFKLDVRVIYDRPFGSGEREGPSTWIVPLLVSLSAEALRRFEFIVHLCHFRGGPDLRYFDWRGIAGALGSARFPSLKLVTVVARASPMYPVAGKSATWEEFVREQMGDIERQGIKLRVSV